MVARARPLVHASSTRRAVVSIAELSRSLRRREDHGEHPGALARADIALFLARIGRAHAAGRISTHRRAVLMGDVAHFLRSARDLGLGAQRRPMFGLPAEFSLTRDDVRRTARRLSRAAARALPDAVVAQLLDEPALGLLEQMHGLTTRRAIELLADTGRRPATAACPSSKSCWRASGYAVRSARSPCRSGCAPSRPTSRPGGQGCIYRYRCVGCEHFRTAS